MYDIEGILILDYHIGHYRGTYGTYMLLIPLAAWWRVFGADAA